MKRLLVLLAIAAPLLAACETSDWMADEEDSYGPDYTTSSDYSTSSSEPDPLSYEGIVAHDRAVNQQNCIDAAAGHDVPCYD